MQKQKMPWFSVKRFENQKTNYTHITLTANKITEIFYLFDECCIEFDKSVAKQPQRNKPKIETVNEELKRNLPYGSQVCQIEHSRHRSFNNFISNLITGLIAYIISVLFLLAKF
ncbi:hypothetical protein [Cyclobacterium plantarum]|uniref:hypothetical protein n=1 Tax=Cyclobacterium plantarum TaxID=2716263 RepID=UPI001C9E4A0A|nr:hypothetical protein [Cyclobacterium plantarum]